MNKEVIYINEKIRLRKYDGNYEIALIGYQDPEVYQNSEGIFDETKIPDIEYINGMFNWLDKNGYLYFIEALAEDNSYIPIGDVTIKDENPPIAIWYAKYRGSGIGYMVMKKVIEILKEMGYEKVRDSKVYKWNVKSQRLHEKLGFIKINETEDEYIYELSLTDEDKI